MSEHRYFEFKKKKHEEGDLFFEGKTSGLNIKVLVVPIILLAAVFVYFVLQGISLRAESARKNRNAELTNRINEFEEQKESCVSLSSNSNGYYEIDIDYTGEADPNKIGAELGKLLSERIPNYEKLLDSFLVEYTGSADFYSEMMERACSMRSNLPAQILKEIDGAGSVFSGGKNNVFGDGKLSRDEFLAINLLPDVARGTACCALAAWGEKTENGRPVLSRTLDWADSSDGAMASLHAITRIIYPDTSICLIGYAGFLGVITALNDNGVFAGILDSSSGGDYSCAGKNSYPLDLRVVLRGAKTIEDVSNFMTSESRQYTFSHLVFLCDKKQAGVIENCMEADLGSRVLRYSDSKLLDKIEWGIKDAICAVNSFVLDGDKTGNHFCNSNIVRWAALRDMVAAEGMIDAEELKSATLSEKSRVFNSITSQIVIFTPGNDFFEAFLFGTSKERKFIRIPVKKGNKEEK